MAKTTVNDLAQLVGTPVDRLLRQMRDAGLPHKAAEQDVSDADKKTLLSFLKTSHGESQEDAPTKITLKRKTVSKLKTGQGKKTVNVEVRKKRTYVKRDDEEDTVAAEEVAPVAEENSSKTDVAEAAIQKRDQRLRDELDKVSEPEAEVPSSHTQEEVSVEETTEVASVEEPAAVEEVVETPVEDVAETEDKTEPEPTVESDPEPEAPSVEAVEEPVVKEEAQQPETPVAEEKTKEPVQKTEKPAAKAKKPQAPKPSPSLLADDFDPEKLRLAAAERRRKAEEAAKQEHQEKMQAIKDREEAERKRKEDAKKKAEEERQQKKAKAAEPKPSNNRPSSNKPSGNKPEAKKPEASARPKRPAKPAPASAPDNNDSRGKKRKGARSGGSDDDRNRNKRGAKGGRGVRTTDHSLHIGVRDEYEDVGGERSRRRKRKNHPELHKHGFEKPVEKQVLDVEIGEAIVVSELAQKMAVKSGEVIKFLFTMGSMVTINQVLDQDTAVLVIEEFGHTAKLVSDTALEDDVMITVDQEGTEKPRPPVVTVMGHVDHGKTSLLDYIRKAKVASGEAGGITQHIGAYHVETDKGVISFLDTPGHAAFTAMRARGAQSTDIVILVVAGDDGVMPQTEEAVKHAKAAGVPLIVAINKMDKEGADPDRVKNELSAHEVIPEDWGGEVQFIPVSAHTGQGIDELLEAVLLESEVLELTAPEDVAASGVVIESSLDKGRGPVANLMIQRGTLKKGDIVLAGQHFGRVRAMLDENGKQIEEAGPSIPVQILGLDGTADAGDTFVVVESEKKAREVADFRAEKTRQTRQARQQAAKLDNLFSNMASGKVQSLNVVVKADVRGSLEAIQTALLEIGNEEVKVNIVSGGVGGIAETDINLAITSGAVVFGFNVRADNSAKQLSEAESVDMRYYSVIYDLLDDVKQALTGMLAPELREEIVGIADVRETFRSPKFGQVAGCMVTEGTVYRSKPIRVLRDNVVIYEGELESLRRFKDDVADVRNGFECGIGVKNYDVKVGDKIEVFETREFAREL